MGKFRELGRAFANSSEVTLDREKIDIDVVAARYPDGITITNFDIFRSMTPEKDDNGVPIEVERRFAVISFAEDDTVYFNSRTKLSNMIKMWVSEYGYSDDLPLDDPDNQAAISQCRNDYMMENDYVKVRIIPNVKMRNGNKFTDIVVL